MHANKLLIIYICRHYHIGLAHWFAFLEIQILVLNISVILRY